MNITPQEFERYAKGLASAEEKDKIETWLNYHAEELPKPSGECKQLAGVWSRLATEIGNEKTEQTATKKISLWKNNSAIIWKIAACIVLAFGIGRLLSNGTIFNKEQQSIANKIIRTQPGQRKEITLPDGSKVILNAASELIFPETFTTDDKRLVKLKGEALFDIAHDARKPFIIHTDSSFTQVLGTKFNLSAYSNDNKVVLSVERGKVLFGRVDSKDQVILKIGMQGTLAHHQKVSVKINNGDNTSNWINNVLEIHNESLAEVAKKLERWYGVTVKINSATLKETTITGTYEQASLKDILNSLSFSADFKYDIKDKIVTIIEK